MLVCECVCWVWAQCHDCWTGRQSGSTDKHQNSSNDFHYAVEHLNAIYVPCITIPCVCVCKCEQSTEKKKHEQHTQKSCRKRIGCRRKKKLAHQNLSAARQTKWWRVFWVRATIFMQIDWVSNASKRRAINKIESLAKDWRYKAVKRTCKNVQPK